MRPEDTELPNQGRSTEAASPRVECVDDIRREIIRFTQAICNAQGATDAEMAEAVEGARAYWRLRSEGG